MRIVESRRLREILQLCRPELKDSEVPRRTKTREEVLRNWAKWFKVLRQELAVRLTSCESIVYANLAPGRLWTR